MEVPLVDKDYLLERTPGNGGWTYAPIPEVPQDKKAPFDANGEWRIRTFCKS